MSLNLSIISIEFVMKYNILIYLGLHGGLIKFSMKENLSNRRRKWTLVWSLILKAFKKSLQIMKVIINFKINGKYCTLRRKCLGSLFFISNWLSLSCWYSHIIQVMGWRVGDVVVFYIIISIILHQYPKNNFLRYILESVPGTGFFRNDEQELFSQKRRLDISR